MQASDNDGELANASRAIARLLQRHGADWHDVVEVLLAEPPAAAGLTPDATTWKRSSGAVDLPREQLIALIDLVEEHSSFLPLKSREFVARCARALAAGDAPHSATMGLAADLSNKQRENSVMDDDPDVIDLTEVAAANG